MPLPLRSFSLISIALFLVVPGAFGQIPVGKSNLQIKEIKSDEDLVATVKKLDEPDKRMNALSMLIRFSGLKLYNRGSIHFVTPDKRLDELEERAVAVVIRQVNIETITKALDSDDPELQFWAVSCWGGRDNMATEEKDAWRALLPKIKRLSVVGDGRVRRTAVERLEGFPEAREFLDGRIRNETSADVQLMLLWSPDMAAFSSRINKKFTELLNNQDEVVRRDALSLIGFNSNHSPMWRIEYDKNVFDRVLELTNSESEKERGIAVYALSDIRKIDTDRSREAFIRLAKDRSVEIRWRLAAPLVKQAKREDVGIVLKALLKDESSLVRYFTINALGAEKHVPELKILEQDTDPNVARFAAGRLKRLKQEGLIKN